MTRDKVDVTTKDRPAIAFYYNMSDNLAEAVQMFEEKSVHDLFIRALTIAAQANARKMLAAGFTEERIQNEMETWKPGVTVRMGGSIKTVDPVKVITENFDDWTEERQQEIFDLIAARFASRGQKPAAENTEQELAAVSEGVNGGGTAADQSDPNRRR